MKKFILLSIVSFLFVSFQLSAESKTKVETTKSNPTIVSDQNNSVKGMVIDKLTNETLAGAVITANGKKVYSDLDGNFTLSNLCEGKCQLKISLISYEDQTIDFEVNNSKNLKINLQLR